MALNTNLHVLIVDDSSQMRRVITKIVKEIGFSRISEAEDGVAAFSKLKVLNTSETPIELILLDWSMPRMSGIEFTKTLRADPSLKHIPVLMITSEARQENVVVAVKSGVQQYLVKPFTAQMLQEKLEKIL